MHVQTYAHSTGPSLIIRKCKEKINSVVGYKKAKRKKEEERGEKRDKQNREYLLNIPKDITRIISSTSQSKPWFGYYCEKTQPEKC